MFLSKLKARNIRIRAALTQASSVCLIPDCQITFCFISNEMVRGGRICIACMDLLYCDKSLLSADNESTLVVSRDWSNMSGIQN
jgi:hypothetical protein